MGREEIQKLIQGAYMAGDEGEPEESAVPHYTDKVLEIMEHEREEEIRALLQELNKTLKEDGVRDENRDEIVFSYWSEREPHGLYKESKAGK